MANSAPIIMINIAAANITARTTLRIPVFRKNQKYCEKGRNRIGALLEAYKLRDNSLALLTAMASITALVAMIQQMEAAI